jgi:RNA polymerase sigma-70 factor (ECF subfamily)
MTASRKEAMASKEQQDFEAVLTPALKAIYKAAYGLTRNRDEAEDLVQEAAVQAFRAFYTFQPGTNFKAWFLRILTNLFYARYRKQQREPQMVDAPEAEELYLYNQTQQSRLPDHLSDPAALLLSRIDTETILQALEMLPDDYRVVATMYFVDQFSYQDIADMLNIPIGTVRSRLHRARKLLQVALWELAQERGIIAAQHSLENK